MEVPALAWPCCVARNVGLGFFTCAEHCCGVKGHEGCVTITLKGHSSTEGFISVRALESPLA